MSKLLITLLLCAGTAQAQTVIGSNGTVYVTLPDYRAEQSLPVYQAYVNATPVIAPMYIVMVEPYVAQPSYVSTRVPSEPVRLPSYPGPW